MIDPQKWASEAATFLKEEFGPRLLYVGLQGSYQRGEATEKSDIDLVTLLDNVSMDDLDRHRSVTQALPEGDKTCGFICSAAEFAQWPRHELFPFKMDTDDYYGRLEDFMPPVSRADIVLGVNISASALLHVLRHSYLYGKPGDFPALLAEARKSAFFIMRVAAYLQTGQYHASQKSLLSALSAQDRAIFQPGPGGGLNFEPLIAKCREWMK